ncbi:beta-ketoacyl synthase N-terminal-like domain-containing protein [Streptomyces sp. 6N223]|uniref:beta-ketoacyl synthase N-terminal-like domain-containing protein n=1 Tax=Streptomyces sp. 6N223 TaxID=3457412 RepID=UPI003FD23C8D
MSEQPKPKTSNTSEVLKQSVLTIQTLRRQLDEATNAANARTEPVAVVGLACRFPGGCDTPEKFWSFLRDGGVGVRDVPADRWDVADYYAPAPGRPGKIYVRESNFLDDDVAEFDGRFFKISPREAGAMDPQQRQLLEVCWEALENAGQHPGELRGSSTGVFVGISSNSEYAQLVRHSADLNEYIGIGTTSSIASGRISYAFGWNGPALSIDTACSSSLVGTQTAVESLRRGECDMALAGGVNLMLAPGVMSSLCMMNALAQDGRSKPFDAAADGYGRGEGTGVVVLKRLSDARRDGDTIYALIHGGAVNNDGESSGLTVPNGRAQKAVLSQALANTGVAPEAVGYVETHGTGTLLGDPIEIDAIHQVYGEAPDRRLVLGAVKGNIGHLESAAGVASLIKTVLCLHHGEIPPITGLSELNPRIRPLADAFVFPDGPRPWPATPGRTRYAAVSSFGFSGTNAHMILSEAPQGATPGDARPELASSLLTLSATDEKHLVTQIQRYADHLAAHPETSVEDLCFTANACRSAFTHRAVFLGRGAADLQEGFRAVLQEWDDNDTIYSDDRVILGSSQGANRYNAKRTLFTTLAGGAAYTARTDEKIPPKLAFVFGGDAGETLRVARGLAELFPAFREAHDAALAAFGDEKDENGEEARLFAAEYALAKLLESYGVTPEITFGERTGSLVAAVVSGVLSLEAAARHVLALGAARQAAADPVAFARVVLEQEAFDSVLRDWQGDVHVSAVYAPAERVISGPPQAIEQVGASLAEAGAQVTEETGAWPSAAYQGQAAAWRESVAGETYAKPASRYQSPHTLRTSHEPAALREDFHAHALTAPVRFGEGVESLYEQGYRFFVELGGAPRVEALLDRLDLRDVVTLRPAHEGEPLDTLLRCLAQLTVLGSTPRWEAHYAGQGRRKLMLPNYPFEPTRHWLAGAAAPDPAAESLQARLAGALSRDGLQGQVLNLPVKEKQYLYTFTHDNFPELRDNSGVLHVGYYLEMLRAVAAELYGERPVRIRDMAFMSALMVLAGDVKEVLLVLEAREPGADGADGADGAQGAHEFRFHSRNAGADGWDLNVRGVIAEAGAARQAARQSDEPLPLATAKEGEHVTAEDFYRPLEQDRGFYFGPAVRWVAEAWHRRAGHEGLIRFAMPEGPAAKRSYALGFHPGVLDSCAQSCNYLAVDRTPGGKKYMVAEMDDIVLRPRTDATELFAAVRMPEFDAEKEEIAGALRLVDGDGATLVSVGRIRLKEFDEEKLGALKAMMDGESVGKGGEDRDFLMRYVHADAERRRPMVLDYVGGLLAVILEMEPDEVSPGRPLRDFGLDSMTGLTFYNRTAELLAVDISFADLVKSTDLNELSEKLVDLLPGGTGTLRDAQTKAYDGDLSPSHWIYRHEARPEAKIRLFCFPNGYRNADLFDDWQEQLGPEVDVCAIMLPGLDAKRLDERPPADIDAFMETMEKVVDPALLDLPCASFGHSWGALFSFRLAHRLGLNAGARFVRAFVSGFAAPAGPNPSIQKILHEVGQHGMTHVPTYEEIRHDPETVNAVIRAYQQGWDYGEAETRATLPQLLAACSLIDRYQHDEKETFAVPITAFHGVDDWVASEETKLWEAMTTGSFTLHTMAGDHQFINRNQSEARLLTLIRAELLAAVGGAE